MSQAIHGKALHFSTYEKELMALVLAVKKWQSYLLGHTFKVQTDKQSIKYLLKQKIGTTLQQKWMAKILGFDFVVECRQVKDNKVADALSRKMGELSVITMPSIFWWTQLRASYTQDPQLQTIF